MIILRDNLYLLEKYTKTIYDIWDTGWRKWTGVEIGQDRPWFEGCQLGEGSNIQYTIQSPFVCSKFSIIKSFFNFFIMLLGIKKVKF